MARNRYIPVFAGMTIFLLFFAHPAFAQSVTLDLGKAGEGSAAGRLIELVILMTVISLAPSILIMTTSFLRIIIVLSFLRSALGLQSTPPNQVLISLALFLTAFIMAPAFEQAWNDGVQPLMDDQITQEQAFDRIGDPFHVFMLKHVREKDLALFVSMSPGLKIDRPEETPYRVLVPAFMISELKRAFEIGFLIFIPFVIIDMLVASILMAMGMMMLPPVMISLPFKLIFFVMVDGWYMLCGSLIKSFGTV
ncbi:MAG: flagellar type III secretion system pore protein FliP [Pseudomonadota bacterium]|nr:flagellar type III secretion system pore protein FliP [Pseudomonadota bacterium]MDE3038009.1 flagellar type III secretion system pore protein FliP [Pseudomonadota bacterium]